MDSSGDSGIYTFRFIFAILYKLGLSSTEPVKTIMEYVNVPVPTNVFTVMQPFFQDYSLYGVAFGAMFYRVIYASVYICARQDSPVAMLIYAVLAVGLFTSFFAETLITNFSGNMKLIICIYILWRFTVVQNKRIAILMATYNGGEHIENQLLSLQQQKYKDWILYIHDDGSKDNTVSIT